MNTEAHRLASPVATPSVREGLWALMHLTKPGVTRLVVATTALGAAMAPGALRLWPLLFTVVGTVLVVGCANALNMYLESDVDALMTRTKGRPLPAGLISHGIALAFGLSLGAAGVLLLGMFVNPLAGELAMLAIVSYVLVYTPMKAVSPIALHIGALPGAIPPLLGYAGLRGTLEPAAWAVFLILFVWQIPHFLAITLFRAEEYRRAGLRVLPVVKGMRRTLVELRLSSVLLVLATLLPPLVGLGGVAYLTVAIASGVAFLVWVLGARVAPEDIPAWGRKTFFLTMPHLVLLFVALALSAP